MFYKYLQDKYSKKVITYIKIYYPPVKLYYPYEYTYSLHKEFEYYKIYSYYHIVEDVNTYKLKLILSDDRYLHFIKTHKKLPEGIKSLKIKVRGGYDYDFSKTVISKILPYGLKKFKHNFSFNEPLKTLPNTIKSLRVNCDKYDDLPSNIEKLYIPFYNNSTVLPLHLTSKLTTLHISILAKGIVIEYFPETLINLYIGHFFNQPVNNLPKQLKILKIYNIEWFDHFIDDLPNTLEKLSIRFYNNPISNLPESLIKLSLKYFRNTIALVPHTLRKLKIGDLDESNIILPRGLEELYVTNIFKYRFLPGYIRVLKINKYMNRSMSNIPSSCRTLKIKEDFDKALDCCSISFDSKELTKPIKIKKSTKELDKGLTNEITNLCISSTSFNRPLNNLPSHLTVLRIKLGGKFKHNLDNLPDSLEELTIEGYYTNTLDKLPKNLKILNIYCFYHCKLNQLPESLETLTIAFQYMYSLHNLPNKLRRLYLPYKYEDSFKFPSSLKVLCIDKYVKNIPDTVENLYIRSSNTSPVGKLPSSLKLLHLRKPINCRFKNILYINNMSRLFTDDDRGSFAEIPMSYWFA